MVLVYISVGSNINRDFNIRGGLRGLAEHFGALTLSSVYESEAVGFCGDPFYNMVVGAETDLSIGDCIRLLKQIEDQYGRVRGAEKFSGRTLDLDLLTYDQVICDTPVQLPRGEITENAFVLWPLAEIAAEQIHPVTGQSYAALWQAYNKSQKLWPIDFSWSD
ncbi:2-amino-4-hydroxy-6-hydroxymethyldihydropteridine diphosphokinase [Alishewanella longhuensis]|uniref:2-amino-4-hydroxy-6-hydroxymethyldihydropteridine diphosphokinase n=1 Tax=Alishewanella longhuensis TaxID=1091037 RepID=A0ABQ3KYP6_9ALTE|nr:2-amino-4-hydroxy-6-hydroxymethyldihydropteridine diphosphokinase [Alishewanella longhuensis]GHG61567.1 2-amino-4-hydroxy-6-hydroxymethyldihydropteridine diphosphokinase [Alishewanella longhuensis]